MASCTADDVVRLHSYIFHICITLIFPHFKKPITFVISTPLSVYNTTFEIPVFLCWWDL